MAFAELAGLRLHYEVAPALTTRDDRPVLVLSNSLGTNLSMWEPQLQEFSAHFRLLRYDTRGHGRSSVPPGPYTVEMLGQDLLRLLDRLEIEQTHFCGLSLGGVVGQWLGVYAPERLHKLVLSSTAAKIGTVEGWNQRIEALRREGMQPVVPGILERWFTADFRERLPETVAKTAAMLFATSLEGYTATSAAVRDADQRSSVSRIVSPTLVIAGTHDPVTPPADGHWLQQQIPGAEYVELDAAHLCNVEAAGTFTAAVMSFLLG